MLACGKNVLFMTDASKIGKVYLNPNKKDKEVLDYIIKNKLKYKFVNHSVLDKMVKENHQGVVFEVEDFTYSSLESLFSSDFLLILDHIEDPHNFGAIIRSAEACGVGGIIIPKDRCALVNETVMKTSVGTFNEMKIAKVTNLVDTIRKLKKENYFIYGSIMNGIDMRDVSYSSRKVLVIGNEGKGLSSLVEKNCDVLVKIPMVGKVNSLNASVASGILLFQMGGLS